MKPKTIRILYWIFISLFALMNLMDGLAGLSGSQVGKDSLHHLGYPVYIMPVTGFAKCLAAIALLQNKYKVIKEWAFAGNVFTFLLAAASHYFSGDSVGMVITPLIMLAFLFIPYTLWKRFNRLQESPEPKARFA